MRTGGDELRGGGPLRLKGAAMTGDIVTTEDDVQIEAQDGKVFVTEDYVPSTCPPLSKVYIWPLNLLKPP